MRLYSKEEWAIIPWLSTEEGIKLRSFFEPILQEGTSAFVSNVESQVYILHIDDLLIPVTVNEKEYRNSYVCSMYSFLLYTEEEMTRHRKYILRFFVYPFLTFLKLWFRWSRVNQLVIVNNFLLSTNLYPNITAEQSNRIFQFLKERFVDHAIIFRSLNNYTEKNLSKNLCGIGLDFITSRSVYFFEPKNYRTIAAKMRWNIKSDKRLREGDGIEIVPHHDFQLSDAAEIKHLYDLLYLKKYSTFNPAFTVLFFERAIRDKTFTLTGIRYKGRLVGVVGVFKVREIMTAPIVGYDTKLPEELGLYRMLISLIIEEALFTNTILHLSSGVGHFKRKRGAFQEIESMAVACNHLPFHRRFVWKAVGFLLNKIGTPILKKYKL
jgi:hypothetical protein